MGVGYAFGNKFADRCKQALSSWKPDPLAVIFDVEAGRKCGSGTGTMKRPPRRRYSACCSTISSMKFHVRTSTKSGWRRSSSSGAKIGSCTPGIAKPCLVTLRSTTKFSMR